MDNMLEEYLLNKADQEGNPLKATLELTPLCNMNCSMCYIRHSAEDVRKKGGLMPLSFWQGLIPQMKEMGVLFTALIGGEIFTLPYLEPLYMELHQSGFYINLTTNAVMLSEKVPEWMVRKKPRYVTVSLYGASDETYEKMTGDPKGYTKTIAGINNLLDAGIPTKLNVLIGPENVQDIDEIARFAKELDLPVLATSYVFPQGVRTPHTGYTRMTPEQAAEAKIKLQRLVQSEEYEVWLNNLIRQTEAPEDPEYFMHFTCRAARSTLWVNWQGRMAACGMLESPSVDLKDGKTFREAWGKLKLHTQEVRLCKECAYCKDRTVCPVCPAMMHSETGAFSEKPEYLCRYTKELVRLAREQI